jgi:hypothetical protein
MGRERITQNIAEVCAIPVILSQQILAGGKRMNAGDELSALAAMSPVQTLHRDGLDHCQHILYAMIEFLNEEFLALFRPFAVGYVKR